MKKIIFTILALVTLMFFSANAQPTSISYEPGIHEYHSATNTIQAYSDTYSSKEFSINSSTKTVWLPGNSSDNANYHKNPYYNSTTCAPGNSWCTCFEYSFTFHGTTYFFQSLKSLISLTKIALFAIIAILDFKIPTRQAFSNALKGGDFLFESRKRCINI